MDRTRHWWDSWFVSDVFVDPYETVNVWSHGVPAAIFAIVGWVFTLNNGSMGPRQSNCWWLSCWRSLRGEIYLLIFVESRRVNRYLHAKDCLLLLKLSGFVEYKSTLRMISSLSAETVTLTDPAINLQPTCWRILASLMGKLPLGFFCCCAAITQGMSSLTHAFPDNLRVVSELFAYCGTGWRTQHSTFKEQEVPFHIWCWEVFVWEKMSWRKKLTNSSYKFQK